MKRTLARLACLAASATGACGDATNATFTLDWMPDTLAADAVFVEVSYLEGGCTGPATRAPVLYRLGDAMRTETRLDEGRYGLSVRARNDSCVWFAAGCVELDVPIDDGSTAIVPMEAVASAPACAASERCRDGACEAGDASMTADAGDAGSGEFCAAFSSAVFCSSFEDPLLAELPFSGGGMVERSTSEAASGGGSLRARTTAAGATAIRGTDDLALPAGTTNLYVRMSVLVAVPADNVGLWRLETAGGTFSIGLQATRAVRVASTLDRAFTGNGAYTDDAWFCLSMRIPIGASARIDGTVSGTPFDIGPLDTRDAIPNPDLRVGLVFTGKMQPTAEVFIDDLVVSTAPVPCP